MFFLRKTFVLLKVFARLSAERVEKAEEPRELTEEKMHFALDVCVNSAHPHEPEFFLRFVCVAEGTGELRCC